MICADVDEALEIADRVLLVRDHSVVAEYSRAALDRATLVAELAGSGIRQHSPQTAPRSTVSA